MEPVLLIRPQLMSKYERQFAERHLAETREGEWILIEINDAQMAVPSEHDLDELYSKLKEAVARS